MRTEMGCLVIWVVFPLQLSIILAHDTGNTVCKNSANYTQNSTYQHNLDHALSSLPGTNNGYGFFTSSSGPAGDEPNTANAIALCRGDADTQDCAVCVANATSQLRRICPNQRGAFGWYDYCLLVYSNENLNYTTAAGPKWNMYNCNGTKVMGWSQFSQTLGNLFHGLRGEAASGGEYQKYASSNMTGPGSMGTIYGTMQCVPDLSQALCDECLVSATQTLADACYGEVGGTVYYQFSCIVRYERYLFYGPTWIRSLPSELPTPPPSTTPLPLRPGTKSVSKMVFIGPVFALAVSAVVVISIFLKVRKARKNKGKIMLTESEDDTGEVNYFKLSMIQEVTNNFSLENKLGEGGFGPVYSGELPDGKKIAVKRLSQNSSQGLAEFKTEVKLIIKLQHKNLVKLLGYCIKRNERLLVYEYMANKSLDAFLFDPRKAQELVWDKRAKIVRGIAKGLRYLHEDSRLKVIHRDLKASNVLLDEDMNPKISDFGTARIFGLNQIDANTDRVVGTYGYMAPEYAMEGLFSTKSDVYSFGVLLLEIICGQRNSRLFYQEHGQNLLSYAWMLWKEQKGEQLIDANLLDDCPISEVLRYMNIALLCIQEDPKDRPTMSSVACMLEGEWASLPMPSEPPMSFANFIITGQSSTISCGEMGLSSSSLST